MGAVGALLLALVKREMDGGRLREGCYLLYEDPIFEQVVMNEYTIAKLRRFGPIGRLLQHINFQKLPLALQTNLYVIAHKTGTGQ